MQIKIRLRSNPRSARLGFHTSKIVFASDSINRNLTKPFIKWVGGKGQLLEQLSALLPKDLATRKNLVYGEPFVGGGAMLFFMLGRYPNITRAVINDLNRELVATYR